MRLLVIFAHPSTDSFGYALFQRAVKVLEEQGHRVETLDLYRIGFDPVLSTEEWHSYISNTHENIEKVQSHVEKLQQAEGLVFIFPTFFYGVPAILKGWFERIWLPGVAFEPASSKSRRVIGKLKHIRSVSVITTSGSPKWWLWLIKDPVRSVFKLGLRPLFAARCKFIWSQLYNMNHVNRSECDRFMDLVEKKLKKL